MNVWPINLIFAMKDGLHNATKMVALWNRYRNGTKSIEDFTEKYSRFCEAMGYESYQFKYDNGILWLDDSMFLALLSYLSAEFTLLFYTNGQNI